MQICHIYMPLYIYTSNFQLKYKSINLCYVFFLLELLFLSEVWLNILFQTKMYKTNQFSTRRYFNNYFSNYLRNTEPFQAWLLQGFKIAVIKGEWTRNCSLTFCRLFLNWKRAFFKRQLRTYVLLMFYNISCH